jgi:hypothetical protein
MTEMKMESRQSNSPATVEADGGWWPQDQQTEDGWTYLSAVLRLELDPVDGVIQVSVADEAGDEEIGLCAVPVAAIAALLAEHFGAR